MEGKAIYVFSTALLSNDWISRWNLGKNDWSKNQTWIWAHQGFRIATWKEFCRHSLQHSWHSLWYLYSEYVTKVLLSSSYIFFLQNISILLIADNVLLNRERNIAKIADMGLAKIVRTDRQLTSIPIYSAGAPIIQSPEQKAGRANGKKNDMWLFGLLIIWMFQGKRSLFMDKCGNTNYPDPSTQEFPNFNDLLSAIFVPENQRYDATNLLYKLEGGWSCVIS